MTTETSERSLLRACLLSLCLLLAVSGCKGTPRVASDLEAELPAELRGDYHSFVVNCSKCHGLERPLTAHVTDVRHWDLYVARMMRTAGSAISESERPRILRFLYWYTQRKNRLANEENAKAYAPPAEETSGAQKPSAASAAPAPAAAGAQDSQPTVDPNTLPAQGKPGESAP
jgi:hypothetical protein